MIVERSGAGEVNLSWVAVRARWRRRGLARAMLQSVIVRCAAEGAHTIMLTTVEENENRTVDLYWQVGFRVVRRQPRYRRPMPRANAAT